MDRRSLLTLPALATAAALSGCGGSSSSGQTAGSSITTPDASPSSVPTPTPSSTPTLTPSPTPSPTPSRSFDSPGGMRPVSGGGRLVGWCGHPGAPGQGRLGVGKNLDKRAVEMIGQTKAYAPTPGAAGRPVVPVMELIATTVHATPGTDGTYRTRIDGTLIDDWLATARKHRALLLLNIQPGRARFIDEVKAYEKWLLEPDVGVALDPEWAVSPGQVPGRVFGHTTGDELNLVGEYLAGLVAQHGLPEKVLVFHQLNPGVVRGQSTMKDFPGVVWIKSVDGIGSPGAKVATWRRVIKDTPAFVQLGFKLFYEEDVAVSGRLMTPKDVLALDPVYVMYE